MILSQPDLREAVKKGEIIFDPPLGEDQWGQASIDLRLGFEFTKLKETKGITISLADGTAELGGLGLWQTKKLKSGLDPITQKPEKWILGPKEFVLAQTYESFTVPLGMIGHVEGRSSYARAGISMHQTAPWIQPGWRKAPIMLEIMNHGSYTIELTPLRDRPCQLTFMRLTTALPPELGYGSLPGDVYQYQKHPFMPPQKSKARRGK